MTALKALLLDTGVLPWILWAGFFAAGMHFLRWLWTPPCPECGGKKFRYLAYPHEMRICMNCGHVD